MSTKRKIYFLHNKRAVQQSSTQQASFYKRRLAVRQNSEQPIFFAKDQYAL